MNGYVPTYTFRDHIAATRKAQDGAESAIAWE